MVKASKRKRKQSKDTPLSPNTKEARKDVIGKYALEVLDVKTSGKARTETYGATAAIIQKAQTLMPWITPKMITSKAERLVKEDRKKKPLRVTKVTPPVDCCLAASSQAIRAGMIPPSEVSISSSATNTSDLTLDEDDEYDQIGRLGLNLHQGAACDVTSEILRHLKRMKKRNLECQAGVQSRFEDYIGDFNSIMQSWILIAKEL
jgi:hypothetical protein